MPGRLVWMPGFVLAGCAVMPPAPYAVSGTALLPGIETPLAKPKEAPFERRTEAPRSIAGACPSPEMSCYPGCAMVGDTLACGNALVLMAGSLAASLIYLAAEETISLQDFCGKYGTLCMKARPRAEPKRFPDSTPCIFLGAGGSPMWGKGLTCKYNCNNVVLEMQLVPPENRCPGDDTEKNLIEWLKIKWLEIKRVL